LDRLQSKAGNQHFYKAETKAFRRTPWIRSLKDMILGGTEVVKKT
jgi:hypothetical protein